MNHKVDLSEPKFYRLKNFCLWLLVFSYFIVIPTIFEIPDDFKALYLVAPFVLFFGYAWWVAKKQPVRRLEKVGKP